MSDLLAALALVLVLEGMWPFLAPEHWRNTLRQLSELPGGSLRMAGLVGMVLGLVLLNLVR